MSAIELDILKRLASGMQSKQIAALIDCKSATVDQRVRRLLDKFDATNRVHLIARAIAYGVIAPGEVEPWESRGGA